ncbi:glycosyltransferase [Streptomyces sp. NPDC001780]
MRVLITTLGSPSHGRAQLPLARALAAAGHEVRVATTQKLAPVFEQDDVQVTTCIEDFEPSEAIKPHLAELAELADAGAEERQAFMTRLITQAVSGPMARPILDAVRPVAREFRPDLILRDGMDVSAIVIAEQLGVPCLTTPSGAVNVLDPAAVLPGLNALREENGLPADEDPRSVVRHGRVDYVPPAFTFARHLPASPLAYRQTVDVDRHSVLPAWVAELPADRPLVFAAIGTALPVFGATKDAEKDKDAAPPVPIPLPDPAATLRDIIGAARLLDECTVVVSTSGVAVDADDVPAHVHITEHLPQPLLLESVDLFLTHGGFNSIRESLRTGTPLAVLPQFADQYDNARRVQELGIGREITDRTPEGIAAVCREVLADPGSRARARQAHLAMLTLPDVDSAVPDLEKIAGQAAASAS